MYPIKQSTAITVPFYVHDVSGDAVTSLTDGSFTKRISKNGAAFGAMTVTISEMENGWYSIPLSSGHSDTTGLLSITFTNAGAKQVNLQFRVHVQLPDDLMATYTQPTGFLAATFPSGTIANTTNITAGTIATVTTLTNLPAITTDWLTAAGTAADFTTEIQANLATSAAQTTAQNDLDIITGASGVVIAAADIAASALDGKGDWNTVVPDVAGTAPTVAEIWDETLTSHVIPDSAAVAVKDVLADTADIQPNYATSAAQTTAQNDLDIITGATGVNLLAATQTSIDNIETDTGTTLDGKINTIGTDTAATQVLAAGATGFAAIDTVVDAVKAKTDSLTFTIPFEVDANTVSAGANVFDASSLATDAVNEIADGVLARDFSEAYTAAADTAMNLGEALWGLTSIISDFGIVTTTVTARKVDGTAAMTFTLDDDTNPTSRTRTT